MSTTPDAASPADAFARIDDQVEQDLLVDTMRRTTAWPEIVELRAFEARHLALGDGDLVLDAGCGRGEVTRALAAQVAPNGRVVGLDASDTMLTTARRLSDVDAGAGAPTSATITWRLGDVQVLPDADGSFDAVRAERLLQWTDDPAAVVAELVRVVRPGGRLGLIDTDWRTLAFDLPDLDAADAVTAALVRDRGRAGAAGGLLVGWCRDAGLVDLAEHAVTHVWTAWDPDAEPMPDGCLHLEAVVPELVGRAGLEPQSASTFLDQLRAAGRAGRLHLSLTMFAVVARKPADTA